MADMNEEKLFFDALSADKKFVDFAGLDYFWGKAKEHIDNADAALDGRLSDAESDIDTLQGVVGDDNSGLVKDLKAVQDVLDGLAGEGTGSVADQISSAIAELDLANTYDAIGAAATAKSEAVAHADGLNTAMDARVVATEEHVANSDIHVTTDDKANWNGAKEAIDNFLKDAALTGEVVDTLKEIQSYIDSDGEAADTMTKNIAANAEAIAVINGEAEGSIAKAKADAIASAKTYTDETIAGLDLANTYEAKGTAAELDAALKTSLEGYADQAEADAVASANDYTDALYGSIKFAQENDIDTLFPTVSE